MHHTTFWRLRLVSVPTHQRDDQANPRMGWVVKMSFTQNQKTDRRQTKTGVGVDKRKGGRGGGIRLPLVPAEGPGPPSHEVPSGYSTPPLETLQPNLEVAIAVATPLAHTLLAIPSIDPSDVTRMRKQVLNLLPLQQKRSNDDLLPLPALPSLLLC